MSTCNRLDLETLGSQLVVPKNLPNHWVEAKFMEPINVTRCDETWAIVVETALTNGLSNVIGRVF